MNKKKDIILIVCDSMRHDVFSKNGHRFPTFRKMMKKGVVFSHAYSTSCWTRPAIASLFTGLWVSNHKVKTPSDDIANEIPTIAEIMQSNGYSTIAINENPFCISSGFKRGFNHYLDKFHASEKTIFKALFKVANKFLSEKISKRLFFEAYEKVASSQELIGAAIKTLKKNKCKRPIFLYIHLMDTHYPYGTNFSQYMKLTNFVESKNREKLEEYLINSLAIVDKSIGRLVNFIEKDLPGACIILLSDHGDALFEHEGFGHGHMKGLYEETVRIPLVIYNKEPNTKGRLVSKPVRIIDILPTILEMNKIEYNELKIDGTSLIPVIKNIETEERTVIFESGNSHPLQRRKGEEQVAILYKGKWKYILYKQSKKEELFNIIKDPKEKINLANKNKLMKDKLKAQITNFVTNDHHLGNYKYGDDDLKKLKALGYL